MIHFVQTYKCLLNQQKKLDKFSGMVYNKYRKHKGCDQKNKNMEEKENA